MNHRFLYCLTGLLAGASFAFAQAPQAEPVAQNEIAPAAVATPAPGVLAGTQPDENAPWPAATATIMATPMPSPAADINVLPAQPVKPLLTRIVDSIVPTAAQGPPTILPAPEDLQAIPVSPKEPLTQPETPGLAEEIMNGGEVIKGPGKWWSSVEYILWLTPRASLPIPLATTTTNVNDPIPGVIGSGNTQILSGIDELRYGNYSGARVTQGFWLTNNRLIGFEVSAHWSESIGVDTFLPGESTSTGVIARPLIDAQAGLQTVAIVAFPQVASGNLEITSDSRIWGGEVHMLAGLLRCDDYDLDLICGVRYLTVDENVEMAQNTTTLQDGVLSFNNNLLANGDRLRIFDRFATENQFLGGQIGIRGEYRLGQMFIDLTTKVAVGTTREVTTINGSTTRFPADGTAPQTLNAGLFAVASNSGRFTNYLLTAVPEFQLKLGYTAHGGWFRCWGGYDFLYMTSAVRAGDQIDPTVTFTQIPISQTFGQAATPLLPQPPHRGRDFWAQGINIGFELRY